MTALAMACCPARGAPPSDSTAALRSSSVEAFRGSVVVFSVVESSEVAWDAVGEESAADIQISLSGGGTEAEASGTGGHQCSGAGEVSGGYRARQVPMGLVVILLLPARRYPQDAGPPHCLGRACGGRHREGAALEFFGESQEAGVQDRLIAGECQAFPGEGNQLFGQVGP